MACVGARPLAMGGAFVGLADDVNATYWNPAGLAQLPQTEATVMHTTTNRDEINYQDYLAYATKRNGMGLGISYISYNLNAEDTQSWYWVSGAYPFQGGYVGLNLKFISDSAPGFSTGMAMDLSYLRKINDKWSAGILLQNFNEPRTTNGVEGATWKRNVRPGVAYRYDQNTIITADYYDLFNSCNAASIRFGAERILKNGLAVRAGYYGTPDGGSSITFGAGGKVGKMQLDGAIMTGDLDNTILLSATGKY
jgi:hypothetical protein